MSGRTNEPHGSGRDTPGRRGEVRSGARRGAIRHSGAGQARREALIQQGESRAKKMASESPKLTEVVFFYIYDIGQRADLKKVAALIPAYDDMGLVKRRDTPASLSLPRPLVVRLNETEAVEANEFESFTSIAKIYDEGALSIIVRIKTRTPFDALYTMRQKTVLEDGVGLTIDDYAEESFHRIYNAIRPAVAGPYEKGYVDKETYTAYCIIDDIGDPYEFIREHRAAAASLLIDESRLEQLHESQVNATLARPFSFRTDDYAVFDMDRCIIIDPNHDYEDLLLIVEHANYQLLELRVLDRLLDRWLDEAERDIRLMYSDEAGQKHLRGNAAQRKFAHIQSLRFDALFILENLENSSKIIGDYYLGQIYARLCGILNTDGWKWSVERRLDTLQSVYDMEKTDTSDQKMFWLEVVFVVVCIVFPLIQIVQVMIK